MDDFLKEISLLPKESALDYNNVKRWIENAIVEDGKFLIAPELTYKNFDRNPNWRPCFYIVKEGYNLYSIGIELAKYIARKGNFIEIPKDEVKRLKKEFSRRK